MNAMEILMPDQDVPIDVKPGQGGKLVYDKKRRTIIAVPDSQEALCTAPGSDDLTFGSLLYEMIRTQFTRHDRAAGLTPHQFYQCNHCGGNDSASRKMAQRPSTELVEHKLDCLMAKHLPRLKAMANKGAT